MSWIRSLSLAALLATGTAAAHGVPVDPDEDPAIAAERALDATVPQHAGSKLENKVTITEKDGFRYFKSNGIPDHSYGQFPNKHNPNSVAEQGYDCKVPLAPVQALENTPLNHRPFGIAVNGVVFDPATAEFWNGDRNSGWNYGAMSGKLDLGLDKNNAHVQPTGAYHYHGMPIGLMKKLANRKQMILVGYAADGFPIYGMYAYEDADNPKSKIIKPTSSWQLKKGTRPSGPGGKYDGTYDADWEYVAGSGDLDYCNGREGVTPEYPKGTYYYVITDSFPFIPRYWKGTPDYTFSIRPGGGNQPGGGGPGGGGPQTGPGGGGPPNGPPGGGPGGGGKRPPPRR